MGSWEVVVWLMLGWATGALTFMTYQVVQDWRERRNPNQANPNYIPMATRNLSDWDIQELAPIKVVPKETPLAAQPVIPPAMQECPECGKAYKRVSQHMRLSHPEKTRLSEDK